MGEDAGYRTVFDISQKAFNWWFPLAGVAFVLAGTVLIWLGKRNRWPLRRRLPGYFMVVFSSFWSLTTFTDTYSEYHELRTTYRNGQFSVVEGPVTNFQPMPYEGHRDECFSVMAQNFCYSDYAISAGFNNSASHGGPIRDGLPVRVSYVGSNIVRLEVKEDALASIEQRKSFTDSAQAEWQQRQEHDPGLKHLNLGFGIAALFMTSWWNLQWQRFMKFWVKPPYKHATIILFRSFFAANLIGAVWYILQRTVSRGLQISDYLAAAEIGGAMIGVVWILVNVVEWVNRNQRDHP
jgi:hypothetical protein